AVAMGKHPETGDERDVAVWWFRHPIPGAQEHGLSRHGLVRVDRATARWQLAEGGLDGQAVWPSMGSRGADPAIPLDPTAHRLGDIPAIVFRWQPPESGDLWCHAREV